MDQLDDLLAEYFDASVAPAGLTTRLKRARSSSALAADLRRVHIEAGPTGLRRISYGRGGDDVAPGGRAHAARARAELAEYLAGRRTFFSVPVDLRGIGAFQAHVLEEARRIPYGLTASYADLARRIGHPKASRAVGNALGANPVPLVIPCHRVIRGDGSWGHYAFGAPMKTALLRLEHDTPALVGCTSTRIVCRRGCAHEQRITERNRVVFASMADAKSVGYRPCKVCQTVVVSRRRSES